MMGIVDVLSILVEFLRNVINIKTKATPPSGISNFILILAILFSPFGFLFPKIRKLFERPNF